jgi:fumarate hydratase, class II
MSHFRIERDSMGEMNVPSDRLYGASTARAIENFPISGIRFGRAFLFALGRVKASCALVNKRLGKLDARLADAIIEACGMIAEGDYDEQFEVDVFQTGSGTSTNMNFNEVAANLANLKLGESRIGTKAPVHPNDHVNMGQSSNDVFPTTIHVAAAIEIRRSLIPSLQRLRETLDVKSAEFATIIKVGRTHLQDATPMTLGQEFSGFSARAAQAVDRIERSIPAICELAIGGTAVGTGINTDPRFGAMVADDLSTTIGHTFGLTFREAANHFAAQAGKDACLELSAALRGGAVSLMEVANDIRWLASGPRCGLGELTLPAVQPGSSIMPGKVNPVIPEALIQVCAQVMGNDLAISIGAQGGYFELNMMMPLIAHNLLQSIEILANAVQVFEHKCLRGIEANRQRIGAMIEQSLMLATPLAPVIGYDKAAEVAKRAFVEGRTIRQVAAEMLDLPAEQLADLLDPAKMVKGHVSAS